MRLTPRHALLLAPFTTAMAWLGLSASTGCQPSATVRYNGRERPPLVQDGTAVRVIAGRAEPPEGHEVLGVVTAQCTALDGATGLGEAPCTNDSMRAMARSHAAKVGGTALFELVCGTDERDRFVSGADAGITQTTIRTVTTCRATVLRGKVAPPEPAGATTAAPAPAEMVTVSGQQVGIDWTAGATPAAPLSPREPAEVGEMDIFPAGYLRLGTLTSRCLDGCARSLAQRALQAAAARRGALAIAETRCDLEGDRWRCRATAVGPEIARPAPASTTTSSPTPSASVSAPEP